MNTSDLLKEPNLSGQPMLLLMLSEIQKAHERIPNTLKKRVLLRYQFITTNLQSKNLKGLPKDIATSLSEALYRWPNKKNLSVIGLIIVLDTSCPKSKRKTLKSTGSG